MLYKVKFADGTLLQEIGDRAFAYCTSLIDITITIRKSGSGADEISLPKIRSNSSYFYNFQSVPNIGFVNKTSRDIKGYPWGARSINGIVDGYLLFASDDTEKTKVTFCTPAARGVVVIPESVTTIQSMAFNDCANMTSVVIPETATSFESRIFTGCTGLTSIVCKCTTPPVSPYYDDENPEFQGVDKSIPVYVPEASIDAYKAASGWKLFTNYKAWSKEEEEHLTECVLTLNVNDEAMGSVKGAGTYESGQEVQIEAVAKDGYKFVQWSDNVSDNPRTIRITQSTTLTAIFADKNAAADKFLLTLLVNDEAMGEVSGGGEFESGEVANIEAKAKEGYVFKEWSDGNKLPIRSLMMTANVTLTAYFEAASDTPPADEKVTITVASNDESMGTVSGGGEYAKGATVTLKANAKRGHEFVQWNDGNTDNPRTITATANATYTATFAVKSQGLDDVQSTEHSVQKVFVDGKLYILRDGVMYDAQGAKVK